MSYDATVEDLTSQRSTSQELTSQAATRGKDDKLSNSLDISIGQMEGDGGEPLKVLFAISKKRR